MFTKKLTKDELKMAVDILKSHYGKYFCETAEQLAIEVSHNFDCDCKEQDVYSFIETRPIEEEEISLLYNNI